jgi:hypothetical protein
LKCDGELENESESRANPSEEFPSKISGCWNCEDADRATRDWRRQTLGDYHYHYQRLSENSNRALADIPKLQLEREVFEDFQRTLEDLHKPAQDLSAELSLVLLESPRKPRRNPLGTNHQRPLQYRSHNISLVPSNAIDFLSLTKY